MGYTKIWPVKSNLSYVIHYDMKPEKTEHEGRLLVSGLACSATSSEAVYRRFMNTRKGYGKKSPRLAYHGIQSFADYDNVTPELAHEIGVKMAQELWSDRFEVVVSTHVDRQHLHNHFIINAVSWADGRMFHESNEDYKQAIRGVSDRLCREYGLTVINSPKSNRHKTYDELHPEKNLPPTVHTLIYQDMDNALEMAADLNDFYRKLEQMGYKVKRFGANGQPLEHPAIKPPSSENETEHKFFRLYKFAPGYTEEDIVQRLEAKAQGRPYQVRPPAEPNVDSITRKSRSGKAANSASKQPESIPPKQRTVAREKKTAEIGVKWYHIWDKQYRPKEYHSENLYTYDGVWLPRSVISMRTNLYHSYYRRRVNWHGLRKSFSMMVFTLKSVNRTSYPKYPSHELRREVSRLEQYSEEALLLNRHKIDTVPDLIARFEVVNEGIKEVNKNRKQLRNLIKVQPNEEEAAPLKEELAQYKTLAKELYHERALLKDIAERSDAVKQLVEREKEIAQKQEVHTGQARRPTQTQTQTAERKNYYER